jgi:hypothetical protein
MASQKKKKKKKIKKYHELWMERDSTRDHTKCNVRIKHPHLPKRTENKRRRKRKKMKHRVPKAFQ